MRAMQAESFTGYGGLKLAEVPGPTLAPGRVLVRLTAAGVTPLTTRSCPAAIPERRRLWSWETREPGVVEDPGDSSFSVGARVMFCGPYGVSEDGTYAEWIAARAEDLSPIPEASTTLLPEAYRLPI